VYNKCQQYAVAEFRVDNLGMCETANEAGR